MQWRVTYEDGATYDELDFNSSEDVDRSRLKSFSLISDGKTVFTSYFDKERKLIFRRRRFFDILGNEKGIVYLVGWHMNVNGISVKSICYIYEDGHIEFDDSRNDLELTPREI